MGCPVCGVVCPAMDCPVCGVVCHELPSVWCGLPWAAQCVVWSAMSFPVCGVVCHELPSVWCGLPWQWPQWSEGCLSQRQPHPQQRIPIHHSRERVTSTKDVPVGLCQVDQLHIIVSTATARLLLLRGRGSEGRGREGVDTGMQSSGG